LAPGLEAAVARGAVEICGAYANVRPNLVADEAFIRNQIIGRAKFGEAFPDAKIIVHADAVDVSAGHPQMPQLVKKSGYKYYRCGRPYNILAKKGIPHDFIWEGADGTEILCWWGNYCGMSSLECAANINPDDDWEGTLFICLKGR
jgi:alpha-mannosidase